MKKRTGWHVVLWGLGLTTLLAGVAAGLVSFVLFGSVFFVRNDEFFADPNGTMDVMRTNGFVGVLLVSIATFLAPAGVVLTCIALALEIVLREGRRQRPATAG